MAAPARGLPFVDGHRRGDMRIDKFLKVSRLIKRRTVAKEACDSGRILLNGKPAKAGAEVSVGDTVTIRFGDRETSVRVLMLSNTQKKDEAQNMYEVI